MPKRRKTEDFEEAGDSTPRKSRRIGEQNAEESPSIAADTPSKRKSIVRGTPSKANGTGEVDSTPKGLRKVLFSTPSKPADAVEVEEGETPTAARNDRSARKKSTRTLQNQTADDESEDEDDVQEIALAKEILDEEALDDEADADILEASSVATAPKRGRPKGKRRERTPSPPPNLPPHELYFFQNRAAGNKTSANTLPSQLLLNHEGYFDQIHAYQDPHETDIKRLKDLHKRAFDQWVFELNEGFNICLYGYGSKRDLVMAFAEHMYDQVGKKPPKIVVVNGYTPGLTIRDVLTTLAGIILSKNIKLPGQPNAILDLVLSHLSTSPPSSPIRLIIHSLDHSNLRKTPTQAILARLASHRAMSLLATCDTPHFGLLWDTTLLPQFRWLHHDATTFQPYAVELDVVDEVNALLGRSGRRLGDKDGVGYVLKSLPENARNLFRILVAEQLASADLEDAAPGAAANVDTDDDILGASDEEEAAAQQNTPSRRGRKPKSKPPASKPKPAINTAVFEGVEYRTLYHKAVEEFVCSSELNFRTLLKEFHDHQIIESRKDGLGTERLIVPFRREELEGILEELV